MTRAAAIDRATDYFDSGEFLTELTRRVAYPTESQDTDRAPVLRSYLADELTPAVSRLGCTARIVDNPAGGWPFLVGGVREARDRAPGMMLLISMAITVAYVASLATSLGVFQLDFWWELAALVTIMLLGHWQEMKAIGQAQGALAALAALLPDDAERVTDDGVETVPAADLQVGDVVLVRSERDRVAHRGDPRRKRRTGGQC